MTTRPGSWGRPSVSDYCDVNWPSDVMCDGWNHPFHGCVNKPGHKGVPHTCKCGAVLIRTGPADLVTYSQGRTRAR